MYIVIDKDSVLYNRAAHTVIYIGQQFTHMWKTFAWLHHFTKRGDLGP